MKHFVTRGGGGQPDRLNKNYPHFSSKPGHLKILFSYALAFVLSILCLSAFQIPTINAISPESSVKGLDNLDADNWPTRGIVWETENLNGTDYYYCYLGYYPQTYVGAEKNEELENMLYPGPPGQTETGRVYTTRFGTFPEYGLGYDRYVRVQVNPNSTSNTYKNGERVGASGTYAWFKVEPIKWWIVDGKNPNVYGVLTARADIKVIADVNLTSMYFNSDESKGNDWATSDIRSWIEDYFVPQSGIEDVADKYVKFEAVQNNVSGNYANADSDGSGVTTEDYVYLPSYYEAQTSFVSGTEYYLSAHSSTVNGSRVASPSDFAIATGAILSSSASSDYRSGAGYYWLRSSGIYDNLACFVSNSGAVDPRTNRVTASAGGFRPMMTLNYSYKNNPPEPLPLNECLPFGSRTSSILDNDQFNLFQMGPEGISEEGEAIGYEASIMISNWEGIETLAKYPGAYPTKSNRTRSDRSWYFYLWRDIVAEPSPDFAGIGSTEGFPFIGTLDGNGRTIEGVGCLFASIENATIKNITLLNSQEGGTISDASGNNTISHINIIGDDTSENFMFVINPSGSLTLYDVNVLCPSIGHFIPAVEDYTTIRISSSMFLTYLSDGLIMMTGNDINIYLDDIYVEDFSYRLIYSVHYSNTYHISCSDCEFHSSDLSASLAHAVDGSTSTLYVFDCLFDGVGIELYDNEYDHVYWSDYFLSGYMIDYVYGYIYSLPDGVTSSKWFRLDEDQPRLKQFYWTGEI